MGNEIEKIANIRMPDYHGSLAYINKFENCTVVGLPHPSSGRELQMSILEFCGSELNPIISQFKKDQWYCIKFMKSPSHPSRYNSFCCTCHR